MNGSRRGLTRTVAASLLAISLCLSPIPAAPALAAGAKPAKLVDTCLGYRKPFERIKSYRAMKVVEGAVLGALAGLATGLLVSALRRDQYVLNRRGEVVKEKENLGAWMLGGAVAGGVAGYVQSRAKAAANRE